MYSPPLPIATHFSLNVKKYIESSLWFEVSSISNTISQKDKSRNRRNNKLIKTLSALIIISFLLFIPLLIEPKWCLEAKLCPFFTKKKISCFRTIMNSG